MLRKKIARRIMAGMLGLGCLFAGATSQARTLVNGIGVHCYKQNETGQDEIFLKFNGTRLNMGNFTSGAATTFTSTSYIFTGTNVTVELWEDDGNHFYDHDDFWESHTFTSNGDWDMRSTLVNDGGLFGNGQDHDYNVEFAMIFTP
jgi:hypothetical protein